MRKELLFWGKVIRNGFILAGLMFVSTWATGTLTWELFKPVVVFFTGYVLTELGRHYKLTATPTKKLNFTTLIF
jgi:hypothetical protein